MGCSLDALEHDSTQSSMVKCCHLSPIDLSSRARPGVVWWWETRAIRWKWWSARRSWMSESKHLGFCETSTWLSQKEKKQQSSHWNLKWWTFLQFDRFIDSFRHCAEEEVRGLSRSTSWPCFQLPQAEVQFFFQILQFETCKSKGENLFPSRRGLIS